MRKDTGLASGTRAHVPVSKYNILYDNIMLYYGSSGNCWVFVDITYMLLLLLSYYLLRLLIVHVTGEVGNRVHQMHCAQCPNILGNVRMTILIFNFVIHWRVVGRCTILPRQSVPCPDSNGQSELITVHIYTSSGIYS